MNCKVHIVKVLAFLLALCLTVTVFTGCEGREAPSGYRSVNAAVLETVQMASNPKYELIWNSDAKAILFKSVESGGYWSSILYDAFLEGNDTANGNSPIYITVVNTKTLKWDTISSALEMEENGSVLCKKIEDGIRVTFFFDTYKIAVPIEYRLKGESLTVSVDSSTILEDGTDYKLVSISLSPNLCSVKNSSENGFLFVPSGSGAIMYTAETNEGIRKYSGEVYGADAARRNPLDLLDDEAVRLPVFGASGGGKGLLGIIEEGAGAAVIEAQAGNERSGYSSIGATFYVRGYDEFFYTFHGTYKGLTQRVNEKISGQSFLISYHPLYGEEAGYNGMAKKYRSYLLENDMLTQTEANGSAFAVTLLGGTGITKSFFGIPYKKIVSLTTFSQAKMIVEDLLNKTGNIPTVRMTGYGDNGIRAGSIAGGSKYPGAFGSRDELGAFLDTCQSTDVFFDADIVYYSKSGSGFSVNFDTAKTAINHKAERYPVSPLRIKDDSNVYYVLARQKLGEAAELAVKKAENYGNTAISFSSLGSAAFSDYRDIQYANKNKMENDVAGILRDIKKKGFKTAVAAANSYSACAAEVLFDTPDTNGGYDAFDLEIPFYQMVFHSYKTMYTPAVNLQGNTPLAAAKSAAYGMGLGYMLSYEYANESDDLDEYKLYGTLYSDNIAGMQKTLVTDRYAELYKAISTAEFVNYTFLDNGVSRSEYGNGITVYVNHTANTVKSPAGELGAFAFYMSEE